VYLNKLKSKAIKERGALPQFQKKVLLSGIIKTAVSLLKKPTQYVQKPEIDEQVYAAQTVRVPVGTMSL
jgi:hypothetical protein